MQKPYIADKHRIMLWWKQRDTSLSSHTSTHKHTVTPWKTTARGEGEQLKGFKAHSDTIKFAFWKYSDDSVEDRSKGQNITNEETILVVWIRDNKRFWH